MSFLPQGNTSISRPHSKKTDSAPDKSSYGAKTVSSSWEDRITTGTLSHVSMVGKKEQATIGIATGSRNAWD